MAVAVNQVRLAFRTPRGRSTMLSPIVVFLVFVVLLARQVPGFEFLGRTTGIGVAGVACAASLLAIVPLAMNQFAIDRTGLTLMLLLPLSGRSILRGKALGNGVVALIPAAICFASALLLRPGGDGWRWAGLPLAVVSTYLLAAPAAAVLSAWFPRAADLNSVGQGSNAHGAAGLLGALAIAAAGAPALLIAGVADGLYGRPAVAFALLLGWLCLALLSGALLLNRAARVFDSRREHLGLIV